MATARSSIPLLLALAGTAACSLLVQFDPEGLPCGDGEACLAGYACVGGLCTASGGQQDPCSFCRADERCTPDKSGCERRTCANTPCPVGEVCVEAGGVPLCVPRVAPSAGHPCESNADCTYNARVCARGQRPRPLPDGGTGFGICLDPCLSIGGCSNNATLACREFRSGLDAGTGKACLASDTLVPCVADADCAALSPEFTCAQFAHPRLGLIQACDLPVPGGAALGEPCGAALPLQPDAGASGDAGTDGGSPDGGVADGGAADAGTKDGGTTDGGAADAGTKDGGTTDGGTMGGGAGPGALVRCARGTCVGTPDGGSVCAPACVQGGCAAPGECRAVESVLGGLNIRPAACVTPTACTACKADLSCGGDAPHCTALLDGGQRCLIACAGAQDAGTSVCPQGQICQQLGGELRCVPVLPASCP